MLFQPKEEQHYEYFGEDKPEVYWVHFTGSDVKNIIRRYGITDDIHVFYVGTSLQYQNIYKQMIQEILNGN